MRKITVYIFLCAFFLVKPYEIQLMGMGGPGDELGYFSHAAAIVFGQFPSYEKEIFNGSNSPIETIGPGLLASPFVFMFSWIDRIQGAEVINHRTKENIVSSWSMFGFVYASIFYFWAGCLLLYRGLKYHVKERYASLAVIFMVLCQGMPISAFRDPIMAHAYEFFLQSFFVFLLLKWYQPGNEIPVPSREVIWIGFLAGMTFLTRYNNIFLAMLWPFVLLMVGAADVKKIATWRKFSLVFFVFFILVLVLKFLPNIYSHHVGYRYQRLCKVLALIPDAGFYFKRFLHVLFGIDWGLLYTAPFILVGLGVCCVRSFPLKKRVCVLLLPMTINLYIAMTWRTQGGGYGYRYIFPSLLPLLVYPLALWIQELEQRWGNRSMLTLRLLALFPVLSMLCFEGNVSTLNFRSVMQYFGVQAWGNNTYQLEIWETFLFAPIHGLFALAQGGMFYVYYLVRVFSHTTDTLPEFLFARYPVFKLSVLIKTVLIYMAPFLFYAGMKFLERFGKKQNSKTP